MRQVLSAYFAAWENIFTNHEGVRKTTREVLLLIFREGLIQELREHYLTMEHV